MCCFRQSITPIKKYRFFKVSQRLSKYCVPSIVIELIEDILSSFGAGRRRGVLCQRSCKWKRGAVFDLRHTQKPTKNSFLSYILIAQKNSSCVTRFQFSNTTWLWGCLLLLLLIYCWVDLDFSFVFSQWYTIALIK